MESRKYIKLEDILSVRVECTCGAALEGPLDIMLKAADVCPVGCDKSWKTGRESGELLVRGGTQLKQFLGQWKTFADSMAASSNVLNFSLEFRVKDDKQPAAPGL